MTDEPANLVEPFIAANKVAYPIVIEKGNKSFTALGFSGFPSACLVDPQGNIVWSGHPASLPEAQIEKALQGARPPGYKLPAGIKSAEKLLEKGEFGKAHEAIKTLMAGKLDDESMKAGQELLDRFEGDAKSLAEAAKVNAEAKEYFEATGKLERLQKQYAGVPGAEGADAKLKELLADPEVKKSIKGSEQLLKAKELDQAKDFDKAYVMYRAITRSAAGTRPGDAAMARMKEIEQNGLFGFDAGCQTCRKSERACEKHKKKAPK